MVRSGWRDAAYACTARCSAHASALGQAWVLLRPCRSSGGFFEWNQRWCPACSSQRQPGTYELRTASFSLFFSCWASLPGCLKAGQVPRGSMRPGSGATQSP